MDPPLFVNLDSFGLPMAEPGGTLDDPGRLFICFGIIDPDFDGVVGFAQLPALRLTGTALHGIEKVSADVKTLESTEIIGDTKSFYDFTCLNFPAFVKTIILELHIIPAGYPDTESLAIRTDGGINVLAVGFLAGYSDLIADGPVPF